MKITLLFTALVCGLHANARELLITGVVESGQTQEVLMPLVRSFNGKISEMADEGSYVNVGDMLMRVDGSEVFSTIESEQESLDVFKATSKRDRIALRIEKNDALVAYEKAKVDLQVAKVKAQVPVNFIGELEYKERQLAKKQAEKNLSKTASVYQEVLKKEKEKENEISLGLQQKENSLAYWKERLDTFTVYAEQPGFVIYSSHPWTGSKYQTGDQVRSGFEVLKVSQNTDMQIVAWVNAIDIPTLKVNQNVQVAFDALPGVSTSGVIQEISAGGEDKQDWGEGLYYEVVVLLDADELPLLSGMSAQIRMNLEATS